VKEALEGKVVIEYPTFHVVLPRHFLEYPTDLSNPSKYFTGNDCVKLFGKFETNILSGTFQENIDML
jgi:hypothetical protein